MMQVISSQSNQASAASAAYVNPANVAIGGEHLQRGSYSLEHRESISPASSRSGSPETPADISMTEGMMGGSGACAGTSQSVVSATSADACMTIVHCLMCHRQGGESEAFSKRAIESLVKKMKDKRDELDSLITAVTSNGSHPTRCVTIQRTLDGRLQVAGRKGFPHVVYARIWRWPDLHKNELKSVKTCQYAFDLKLDLVCVNPYHYERVVAPAIDLAGLSLSPADLPPGSAPSGFFPESGQQFTVTQFPSGPLPGQAHSFNAASGFAPPFGASNLPGAPPQNTLPSSGLASGPIMQPGLVSAPPAPPYGAAQPQRTAGSFGPAQVGTSGTLSSYNAAPRVTVPFASGQPQVQPGVDALPGANQSAMGPSGMSSSNSVNSNMNMSAPLTNQPMPEYWCTITYFELDQQVGEIYNVHASCTKSTVDGYTDPNSTSRFCLGQLSNVHRTDASDHARVHIGKGIQLELVGEGDVWLRCLSDHSVFVQSYYLDREAGRQPYEAVHKIYPTAGIKVFDLRLCYSKMKGQANAAIIAAQQQAAAVQGKLAQPTGSTSWNVAALAGLGVDDLRKLCVFRVSFVKGFGPDYARKCIKETPCWIEVQLNRPLQLLDEVLQSMPLNDLKPSRQFFTPAQLAPASSSASASASGPPSIPTGPNGAPGAVSSASPNAPF